MCSRNYQLWNKRTSKVFPNYLRAITKMVAFEIQFLREDWVIAMPVLSVFTRKFVAAISKYWSDLESTRSNIQKGFVRGNRCGVFVQRIWDRQHFSRWFWILRCWRKLKLWTKFDGIYVCTDTIPSFICWLWTGFESNEPPSHQWKK